MSFLRSLFGSEVASFIEKPRNWSSGDWEACKIFKADAKNEWKNNLFRADSGNEESFQSWSYNYFITPYVDEVGLENLAEYECFIRDTSERTDINVDQAIEIMSTHLFQVTEVDKI